MAPRSGRGSEDGEGTTPVPFPASARSDGGQEGGALLLKHRPWKLCSGFSKVQQFWGRKSRGKKRKGERRRHRKERGKGRLGLGFPRGRNRGRGVSRWGEDVEAAEPRELTCSLVASFVRRKEEARRAGVLRAAKGAGVVGGPLWPASPSEKFSFFPFLFF